MLRKTIATVLCFTYILAGSILSYAGVCDPLVAVAQKNISTATLAAYTTQDLENAAIRKEILLYVRKHGWDLPMLLTHVASVHEDYYEKFKGRRLGEKLEAFGLAEDFKRHIKESNFRLIDNRGWADLSDYFNVSKATLRGLFSDLQIDVNYTTTWGSYYALTGVTREQFAEIWRESNGNFNTLKERLSPRFPRFSYPPIYKIIIGFDLPDLILEMFRNGRGWQSQDWGFERLGLDGSLRDLLQMYPADDHLQALAKAFNSHTKLEFKDGQPSKQHIVRLLDQYNWDVGTFIKDYLNPHPSSHDIRARFIEEYGLIDDYKDRLISDQVVYLNSGGAQYYASENEIVRDEGETQIEDVLDVPNAMEREPKVQVIFKMLDKQGIVIPNLKVDEQILLWLAGISSGEEAARILHVEYNDNLYNFRNNLRKKIPLSQTVSITDFFHGMGIGAYVSKVCADYKRKGKSAKEIAQLLGYKKTFAYWIANIIKEYKERERGDDESRQLALVNFEDASFENRKIIGTKPISIQALSEYWGCTFEEAFTAYQRFCIKGIVSTVMRTKNGLELSQGKGSKWQTELTTVERSSEVLGRSDKVQVIRVSENKEIICEIEYDNLRVNISGYSFVQQVNITWIDFLKNSPHKERMAQYGILKLLSELELTEGVTFGFRSANTTMFSVTDALLSKEGLFYSFAKEIKGPFVSVVAAINRGKLAIALENIEVDLQGLQEEPVLIAA